eukprot:TRINITY_DN33603_c0_g1_i1.p1 TRINITY_DN33603_c0_g1~~TRINITY_DN33603_c0_g1_i1.p1  ORF type:complete len:269 (+),score=38.58 TRINITY_DN33603_c0_g1_i1:477-1283(+)
MSFKNHFKPCCVESQVTTMPSFNPNHLTPAGLRLYDTPNAGGASVNSEVMSIEVLQRVFNATLEATEMEVSYWPPNGPITDYVCKVDETTFGVSVTRAFHYRGDQFFTEDDADTLLKKKLQGVINSTKNVLFPGFAKQVLHVWCQSKKVCNIVKRQYKRLNSSLRANTIVLLSVCSADWIYQEKRVVPEKKVSPIKKVDRPVMKRDPNSRKARKRRARWVKKQVANAILSCITVIMYSGMLWQIWLLLSSSNEHCPPRIENNSCIFVT